VVSLQGDTVTVKLAHGPGYEQHPDHQGKEDTATVKDLKPGKTINLKLANNDGAEKNEFIKQEITIWHSRKVII
jgi:hypothetical protein